MNYASGVNTTSPAAICLRMASPSATEIGLQPALIASSLVSRRETSSSWVANSFGRRERYMSTDDGQVTLLLRSMKNGDQSAAEKLLLVYKELLRLATFRRKMAEFGTTRLCARMKL